jgi:hypothetical protein
VIAGRIALTAWGDTMLLADGPRGEITISVEELAMLDTPTEECRAVFGDLGDVYWAGGQYAMKYASSRKERPARFEAGR